MEVGAIVIAVLGSNVLVEVIKWLKDIFSGKPDPLKAAVCSLLRDRILYLSEKYIEQNSISLKQYESLYDLYENYKNLGGNGFITEEIEKVKDLPRN